MIEFVVKEEDADFARNEVESRTDYKLASMSNSGVVAGFSGGVPSAVDLFIQESDLKKSEPIIKEFIQQNKK